MKRKLVTLALAAVMVFSTALTSFAGQWKQDTAGWWYQNDDSSFLKGGWNWVEGKCYYFTPEGYCLMNTQTPDGFQVDASGAWIVDGVVQTQTPPAQASTAPEQQATVQIDTLSFTPPAGFHLDSSEDNGFYFINQSGSVAIVAASEDLGDMGEQEAALVASRQEIILDAAIEFAFGKQQSSEVKQYTSGTWYRYQFASGTLSDVPGALTVCARISGKRVQMIAFVGDLNGVDIDSIMNNCLK